jgi:hypothetical protein
VLFLQLEVHRYVMYATLVGGWTTIGAMILAGPAVLNTVERGPFCACTTYSTRDHVNDVPTVGISGYWCWIAAGYPTERITLDYLIVSY